MALHRFILRPLSAWGTPLRSDTLTGLLLYRLAEDEGEEAVKTELEAFEQGTPPFILSSAMPAGTVFAPRLPPARRETFARLVEQGCFLKKEEEPLTLFEALGMYKKFRNIRFLPLNVWEKHRASLSAAELFAEYCRDPKLWKVPAPTVSQEMHVTLYRRSGSALDGGLFVSRAFWGESDTLFHLYAQTQDCPRLLARLKRMGQLGYGRDSSTGKGLFSIEEDAGFCAAQPDLPHKLLLSVFSANNMNGLQGWYATEVKTGKAGPAFCNGNPFKSPFLCVQEGALLTAVPEGPYVLHGLHANPAIVQVVPPLTLPCRLAEGEAHA